MSDNQETRVIEHLSHEMGRKVSGAILFSDNKYQVVGVVSIDEAQRAIYAEVINLYERMEAVKKASVKKDKKSKKRRN